MGLEIMNKIIVANESLAINNTEALLEINSDILNLHCTGNNTILIKEMGNLTLNIILEDDSILNLYCLNYQKNDNHQVTIKQKNNTVINYHEIVINKTKCNLTIKNELMGSNNKSVLFLRVLSLAQEININVLAEAEKNTQDNLIVEDIKGITDGGKIVVEPHLEIWTHDILANHLVTISNVNPADIFYLMAKGLSFKSAKTLLLKGFLLNALDDYKNILIGGEDNE